MANEITLTSKDIEKFSKLLQQNVGNIQKEADIALKKAAFVLEGGSKREAPVDTGRLRNSIQTRIVPFKATISPKVKYALSVHDGSKARTITPKKARALRFTVGGSTVFTKKANIPAIKANPFMARALRKNTTKVVDIFLQAYQNVINNLKNG